MTDSAHNKVNWPSNISNGLIKKLMAIAQSNKNAPPLTNHDNSGVCYLVSGLVTLYYTCENISNTQGMVCGPGDWLGSYIVDSETKSHILIEQLSEVEYLYFSNNKIRKLAETEPEVYKWLYHCITKMHPKVLQNMVICEHNKEIRIVYSLLTLSNYIPVLAGQQTSLHISQQQLSTISGLSRPRVNEVLKAIEKAEEIMLERGKIHIIDKQALCKRLAQANLMFMDPTQVTT